MLVMFIGHAAVCGNKFYEQIFVISADENDFVPVHEIQNEALKLIWLMSAVKQIAKDNWLVWFSVIEKAGYGQSAAKLGIKSVDV